MLISRLLVYFGYAPKFDETKAKDPIERYAQKIGKWLNDCWWLP